MPGSLEKTTKPLEGIHQEGTQETGICAEELTRHLAATEQLVDELGVASELQEIANSSVKLSHTDVASAREVLIGAIDRALRMKGLGAEAITYKANALSDITKAAGELKDEALIKALMIKIFEGVSSIEVDAGSQGRVLESVIQSSIALEAYNPSLSHELLLEVIKAEKGMKDSYREPLSYSQGCVCVNLVRGALKLKNEAAKQEIINKAYESALQIRDEYWQTDATERISNLLPEGYHFQEVQDAFPKQFATSPQIKNSDPLSSISTENLDWSTTLDMWLAQADRFFAGTADALTFGRSTDFREYWYGNTATVNHQGILFTTGQVAGTGVSIGVGFGAGAQSGSWALRAARSYNSAGDVIGVYDSTGNIMSGNGNLVDAVSYLPVVGLGISQVKGINRLGDLPMAPQTRRPRSLGRARPPKLPIEPPPPRPSIRVGETPRVTTETVPQKTIGGGKQPRVRAETPLCQPAMIEKTPRGPVETPSCQPARVGEHPTKSPKTSPYRETPDAEVPSSGPRESPESLLEEHKARWDSPDLPKGKAYDLYQNDVKRPLNKERFEEIYDQGYRFDPNTRRWKKPHQKARSRPDRGQMCPSLPKGPHSPRENIRTFKEEGGSFSRKEVIEKQNEIMNLRETSPMKAGVLYEDLVIQDYIGGNNVDNTFSRLGRRMDLGTGIEITIEGSKNGFSRNKLDQLWDDLADNKEVMLIVPKLCEEAKDELARLLAQARRHLDPNVSIFVRETLP